VRKILIENSIISILIIFMVVLLFMNQKMIEAYDNTQIDVFSKIDELDQNKLYDVNQSSIFKVYALLSPEKLPEELKDCNLNLPFCGTFVPLDIFRKKEKLIPQVYNYIQSLLLPPQKGEKYIDSEKFPIRVHYENLEYEYVNAVLRYAEQSYQVEINEIGFIPPPPDGNSGGNDYYDIYLRELGQGLGGYTSPINYYQQVEWCSYSSYCVINSNVSDGDFLKGAIAHEFNHSCQFSMDPTESLNIMEATATYIMDVVFPETNSNFGYLPYFQREPYKSVDFYAYNNVYMYGAFLFPQFLTEYYDNNNPEFILKIWEGTMQTGWTNEPDFLDAIENLVLDYAGHSFQDTYREFAQWRYFTDINDDGNHFINGSIYGKKSTVKIDKIIKNSDLPIIDWCSSNPPAEYGANYFNFDTDDLSDSIFIQFKGNPLKTWSADMLLFPVDDLVTHYDELIENKGFAGTFFINEIKDFDKAVLVVSNLSDGLHDPDYEDWDRSDYSLTVQNVLNPETVVFTDRRGYETGDDLNVDLITLNPDDIIDVDIVVALESGGIFYFYPHWTTAFKKFPAALAANSDSTEKIINLEIDNNMIKGYFQFYSAVLDKENGQILGSVNKTCFGINVDEPKAYFDISPESGTVENIFSFNASESFDAQNPAHLLQVRWDWNDDGIWDTQFSTRKIRYHIFDTPGIKNVKIEVRDMEGFVAQTSRSVEIS